MLTPSFCKFVTPSLVCGIATILAVGTALAAPATPPSTAAHPLPSTIRPFFESHCFDCHGDTEQKGGLRLDNLSADFFNPNLQRQWVDVFDKISTGEMPPKKKKRPPEAQLKQVTAWLKESLVAVDMARRNAAQGRVVLRRLNRAEYENTIHDLLGIDIDLKDLLPEDTSSMGFDNVASALNVSSVLMERYLEAADAALDDAIQTGAKPERKKVQATYGPDVRGKPADYRMKTGVEILPEGAFVLYNSGDSPITCDRARVKTLGHYHFTVSAYAYRATEPVSIRIMAGPFDFKGTKNHIVDYFDLPPDASKPRVIEFTEHLPKGGSFRVVTYGLGRRDLSTPEKIKEYKGPGVAIASVEVDGPLNDVWPPESHTRLFGTLDLSKGTLSDADHILHKFVPRAFRRPVETGEIQPFIALVKKELDNGETFETAIRAGLKAVLCSPEFLFLKETPGKLDDWAIASRLSYFLWSSMPDDELLKLAANRTLSQPAVLRAQTDRLLNDSRAHAFVDNFTGQWLGLRQIEATTPDRRTYPKFDELLEWSMVEETQRFFAELLKNDLSVINFIDSDFSIINEPLARLYNIEGVKGIEVRKVKLPPTSHRGGILGQAAILKITANGTSTSPVVRGAWVMRNIIGRPPKPPPPNVPAIEPDTRGATTIREILAKHRSQTMCASCHANIDPPGFALESFDVIGGWRDNYRTFGGGLQRDIANLNGVNKYSKKPFPPIDASGETADGQAFKNYDEFKKVLLGEKEQVTRCLTEKLLVFATGAGLDFADRDAVDAILQHLRAHDYGMRTLVHEVVESAVFLNK